MRSTTLINANGHLITVKAPEDQPTNDPKEDTHHEFLTDHWMDVAAASYFGFREHGVGAVVVTERDPVRSPVHESIGRKKLLYSPAEHDWIEAYGNRLPARWLDTQFQAYDPTKRTVVVMLDSDGSVRVYTVEGTPAPPQSYELVEGRQN